MPFLKLIAIIFAFFFLFNLAYLTSNSCIGETGFKLVTFFQKWSIFY